jgi:reactive intermediate/imine deaminase
MARQAINPDGMAKPVGPYSNVVTSPPGKLVFVAGQVALDADGKIVGEGDVAAQTKQVMENIRLALEAAGAGFEDVVKIVNYITDVNEFPKMFEVRKQYLREPFPTSTLVEVPALMYPELMIEIEVMAVVAG